MCSNCSLWSDLCTILVYTAIEPACMRSEARSSYCTSLTVVMTDRAPLHGFGAWVLLLALLTANGGMVQSISIEELPELTRTFSTDDADFDATGVNV